MRWAKTTGNTILTIVVILVVLLGAGYIGLALYDWNNLKPKIAKALEDATGRKTTIQGDVTLELDLSPTLGVNDIKIQNADWGAGPTLLSVPHAELEINLFSLLDQRTEIESIYLKQPSLNLETGENGRLNIQPVSKKKEKEKDRQPANFFRKVRIENGDFSYQDHARNKSYQGKLKNFTARADGFAGTVRVDAVGTYSGRDFSIDGAVGSQAGMLTEGNAWRVDVKAKLGDAQAKADGIIPVNSTAETGTLNISAEGDNLSELAALFGVSAPAEKPFQVSGKIAPDPKTDRWQATGDARLGDMTFKADGSVAELTSLNGVKAEISAEGPNLSELTALFGKSSTIENPFEVTGTIAQNPKDNQWLVDAKGTLGEMDVSVDGSLPRFTSLAGLQTDISVQGPNYAHFMALFGVSATVDDPFDLTGVFRYPDPDQRFRGEITGTIGEMTLALDGSMPGMTEIEGLNTTISTKGPDFSKLMAVFTLDVPVTKAFDITTDFSYPDTLTYHMDNTRARIGDSDFTGRIRIDADAKPFSIVVDGASKHLDLAAVTNNYKQEKSGNTSSDRGNGGKRKLIPDRPLPLDILKSYNSEIHLKAGTLLLPRLSLTDFRIDTTLEGGHLNIDTLQSKIGTGAINGRMEVQSRANPPLITAVLNADSIQLDEMVRGMDPVKQIKGNMNMNLDISGSGETYAEVAADLSGKAGMNMSDGRLFNQYMRLLGNNIFSSLIDILNPFDKDREYVDINCMVTRFDIEDGLAESTALILDTPEVAIVGDGKINLKTEEIKIPLNTIPKKNIGIKDVAGVNVSLSKMVDSLQIDGTLANPKVRVDVSSALFSIGKAIGGAALFGPAGIAATLLSGSAGKQNLCQAALEENSRQSDRQKSTEAPSGSSKTGARRSSEQESEQPIGLKNLKVR